MLTFERYDFRAMGTDVTVFGPRRPRSDLLSEAEMVRDLFARLELRFSRFLSQSELSRVNANAGRKTTVSGEFAAVLDLALSGAEATGGLFDPTVLPELTAAGYDRDFALVPDAHRNASVREPLGREMPVCRWTSVELSGRTVTMPPDVQLDFGGLAKGWAVDRAIEAVDLDWVLVDAGGDLRLAGDVPAPLGIGVEDPLDHGQELARIHLRSGAIATSSVTKRSWGSGLHHLIDPRTSRPADTGIIQATVWAETCATAEVSSKRVLIGGPDELTGVPALALLESGELVSSLHATSATEVAA